MDKTVSEGKNFFSIHNLHLKSFSPYVDQINQTHFKTLVELMKNIVLDYSVDSYREEKNYLLQCKNLKVALCSTMQ